MTPTDGLKLRLRLVTSRAAAKREFEQFVASGPNEDELELGSLYYSHALYELEGFR
jgi:hypothetical protein